MKYSKVNTDKLRAKIIRTLETMGMYQPDDPEARRFINELIEVPIEESLISRIMEVNKEENIILTKSEVVTQLYVSNLLMGMEAVAAGTLDKFMKTVHARFNVAAPLNV